MKLELKHIVGYLPYSLKGFALHLPTETQITLSGIGQRLGYTFDFNLPHKKETGSTGHTGMIAALENFKPILRPLSDLTKEIEVNGEKFVPLKVLQWNHQGKPISKVYFETISYSNVQKLYEWHFDIHGLIEKGLAIDINTLKP